MYGSTTLYALATVGAHSPDLVQKPRDEDGVFTSLLLVSAAAHERLTR
jgi:hypothetical protein